MGDVAGAGAPPEDVLATMARIRAALKGKRFRIRTEEDFQEGIAHVLEAAAIPFQREARLSDHERVDFLVAGVGLEVKVQGSLRSVVAQLRRYALQPSVRGLLLVTTRACAMVPPCVLEGKPVGCVLLLRGLQ